MKDIQQGAHVPKLLYEHVKSICGTASCKGGSEGAEGFGGGSKGFNVSVFDGF